MNLTSDGEIAMTNVVVYNDGELELTVSINNETVWLNRNQISELLGRDVKTIGKHINNVFSDAELDKLSVVANFATTAADGKTYSVEYYNLDVVISVGYRVKSQRGVRFRQWATSVLKSYISGGYVINAEKITHQRFRELENWKSQIETSNKEIKSKILSSQYEALKAVNKALINLYWDIYLKVKNNMINVTKTYLPDKQKYQQYVDEIYAK